MILILMLLDFHTSSLGFESWFHKVEVKSVEKALDTDFFKHLSVKIVPYYRQ